MRMHSSVAVVGIAFASAWAAACGSTPAAVETGGVTIHGTVESGAGASSADVSAQSSSAGSKALRVSIEGTPLSVTTDAQGRFLLAGVPAGSVTLRFEGTGVDARLAIGELVDGQVLTITVAISGSSARLTSTTGQGPGDSSGPVTSAGPVVEFTGVIQTLTPPSLVVAGKTVVTGTSTQFKGEGNTQSLADFSVGDTVRVEGVPNADGSVFAREIKRLSQASSNDNDDQNDDHDEDDEDNSQDDDNSGSGS